MSAIIAALAAAGNASGGPSPLHFAEVATFSEICTFSFAVGFGLLGVFLRWKHAPAVDHYFRGFISDALQGAAFFPFILLAISILYPPALELLLKSNRALLSLSGLIAATYVVGEFMKLALQPTTK